MARPRIVHSQGQIPSLSRGGLGWGWVSQMTKETHPHPGLPLEGEGEIQRYAETE